jgi:MoxR-like ATPase
MKFAPETQTTPLTPSSPDVEVTDNETSERLLNSRELASTLRALSDNVERVILGKSELIEACLIGLLAGGHILLEDVPGVGKTMLARALATTLGVSFKRIQFTPDLLPSDITGTMIYDPNESRFHFREGPIFTHVALADEINRSSPKTQSALLECMEEGQVTVDLQTRPLPDPFFVIATQNPMESEGVYPLPDSQLDRFALRLSVGYPHPDAERLLMKEQRVHHPIESLESVADAEQIRAMQGAVRRIAIADAVYDYILRIANASREHPKLRLGLSPRGALMLGRCAQSHAAFRGRDFVIPDDVKALAPAVMSHRLIGQPETRLSGGTRTVVEDILRSVPVG